MQSDESTASECGISLDQLNDMIAETEDQVIDLAIAWSHNKHSIWSEERPLMDAIAKLELLQSLEQRALA